MVIMAETDWVGSSAELAVTVTVLPGGITGGAWYWVGILLAIGVGLNVPHAPTGMQVKFTVGFIGPLVTTAAIPAVAPAASAAGGGNCVLNAIIIAGAWFLGVPQAIGTENMAAAIMVNRKLDWRKLMGRFDTTYDS